MDFVKVIQLVEDRVRLLFSESLMVGIPSFTASVCSSLCHSATACGALLLDVQLVCENTI
jgi:hypothetical protein